MDVCWTHCVFYTGHAPANCILKPFGYQIRKSALNFSSNRPNQPFVTDNTLNLVILNQYVYLDKPDDSKHDQGQPAIPLRSEPELNFSEHNEIQNFKESNISIAL